MKSEKIRLGVIYALPFMYATSIRLRNLTKHLRVELSEIVPEEWHRFFLGKILVILRNCLGVLSPKFDPDIVYASAPLVASSIPALIVKKIKKKTLIIDWDDAFVDFTKHKPKPWEISYWEYKAVLEADKVVVVSHKLEEIASTLRKSKKDIFYIPNGVDLELFNPKKYANDRKTIRKQYGIGDNDIVIGHVGAINKLGNSIFTGLDIAKTAFELLKKDGISNIRFLIVGFGSGKPLLEGWVDEHGLREHFIFTGFVPHLDIPRYIAAMDIVVDPFERLSFDWLARSECKLKEYMAMGKMIITVNIGENICDLDHGKAGILVKDSASIGPAIKVFLRDKKLAKELGKNAMENAKRYDFKKLSKKLEKIILKFQERSESENFGLPFSKN
jgi:glycosyltransferase involved in cell wall biosynthesis